MQYITIKRYKRNDARGRFNIPYGTEIEEHDGLLWYQGHDICGDHSAVMREYFARNDDGLGLERGKLSHAIVKTLNAEGESMESWQARWDKVWNDLVCKQYKKPGQENHWLWSIDFYNAPIKGLQYIAHLVGADMEV